MKKLKGCVMSSCIAKKKKYKKDAERYCPYCGERLSYVCAEKKCFEVIDEGSRGKYCPEHQALHDEKSKKQRDTILKISAIAISAALCAKVITEPFRKK